MDRVALFVDAGYLLAAGAQGACGRPNRALVHCDYIPLVRAIIDYVKEHSHQELLRVYWYDGAERAIPTRDHLLIAGLPDVKLRLGRVTGGKQKGVDSLIVRDVMTLARERAIATAYVLSGDEDIREGIVDAQDVGVRVVLLGVETEEPNQAETLINEADLHLMLPDDRVKPFFAMLAPAIMVPLPVLGQPVAAAAPIDAPPPSAAEAPAEATLGPAGPGLADGHLAAIEEAGRAYGSGWAERSEAGIVRDVLQSSPRVPQNLDFELVRYTLAANNLGNAVLNDAERRAMRRGFWRGVREHS